MAKRAELRLWIAGAALAVAIMLGTLLTANPLWLARVGGAWGQVLPYLATWAPLLVAIAVVWARPALGGFASLGLRFSPFDIVWGIGAGLLARGVAATLTTVLYGTDGLSAPLIEPAVDVAFIITAAIIPVVVAPLIEETFFRGIVQRSLREQIAGRDAARGRRVAASVIAVVVGALVFGLVHLVGGGNAWPTVAASIVSGLAAGTVAAATGRIGGAVIAHATFNAVAVWVSWPQ